MMWLTWIITNWKLGLLVLAISLSVVQSIRLTIVTAERDALSAQISVINEKAKSYTEQSEFNAKVINDAIPYMVEQAQKNAISNFRAKYGDRACLLGSGIIPHGMLQSDLRYGQADSAPKSDDPTSKFVADCASDARRLQAWQEWAVAEKLEAK